jgi:hypothetical protein
MKISQRGEALLEQIVELSQSDRTVLLEQLILMQHGLPEIALEQMLSVHQSAGTSAPAADTPILPSSSLVH